MTFFIKYATIFLKLIVNCKLYCLTIFYKICIILKKLIVIVEKGEHEKWADVNSTIQYNTIQYNTIQYNTIQAIIIIIGDFFIAKLKNYLKHLNAFSCVHKN